MQFTADRKAFAAALAATVRVIKRAATIPILSTVLIEAAEGGVLVTGDSMDIRISIPLAASVAVPGAAALPGHLLNDIVRRLPEGASVAVAAGEDGRVVVKSGRARFQVPAMLAVSYPAMRAVAEGAHRFTLAAVDLVDAFRRTLGAADTDETRVYLNGVFVHHHAVEPPVLRLVSTDGHRLNCAELALPAGADGMGGVIVPREAVPEIVRLALDGEVVVTMSINLAEFAFANGARLVTKLVDGTFPDYLRIVPEPGGTRVVADVAALREALGRVALVTPDKRGARLHFADGSLTLTVESGDKGAYVETMEVIQGAAGDEPLTIGFSPAYIGSTLDDLDCDEVEIAMSNPGAPGLFRPKGRTAPFSVVMPMRL